MCGQNIKSSPPHGQSKEDRRIMIRLAPDHKARKFGTFELRQTIQKLVPDSSLISDVWNVPSGVAILAPTPAKAATIL
ncbi:putative effector protein [Erysiphe necator]|uniref:Putative effector protein n=1 Tax=Uncinula necator TaxID=52586 RepID=A0A0B1PAC0_UNCNE|nr:putative effector protein [Erysiphe necator]